MDRTEFERSDDRLCNDPELSLFLEAESIVNA